MKFLSSAAYVGVNLGVEMLLTNVPFGVKTDKESLTVVPLQTNTMPFKKAIPSG
jgi:hypothetical protein